MRRDIHREPTTVMAEEKTSVITLDAGIERAGGFGRFQTEILLMMGLTYVACTINMVLPVYLQPKLLSEWSHLTKGQVESSGSLFFAGFWTGLMVLGSLADRIGRRKVIVVSMSGMLVSSMLTFCVSNFALLSLTLVSTGFLTAGAFNCAVVVALEVVPHYWRVGAKAVLAIFWDFGLICYSLVAYLLRNYSWRALAAVNGFTLLSLVINGLFLPESPRFLLTRVSSERASEALFGIANKNGNRQFFLVPGTNNELNFRLEEPTNEPSGVAFLALWKRQLVAMTIAIGFAQFAGTMAFYGLTFSSSLHVSNNKYLSTVFGALAEIPGVLLTWYAADKVGRRTSYVVVLAMLGISLIGTSVPWLEGSLLTAGLVLLGRFAAAGSTMVCYVISAECFATDYRSAGVAWGSSCGRLGAIIAPVTIDLPFSSLVYAVTNLVASVTTFVFIPETLGAELDDS